MVKELTEVHKQNMKIQLNLMETIERFTNQVIELSEKSFPRGWQSAITDVNKRIRTRKINTNVNRLIRPGLTYHHTVARQLLTTNF